MVSMKRMVLKAAFAAGDVQGRVEVPVKRSLAEVLDAREHGRVAGNARAYGIALAKCESCGDTEGTAPVAVDSDQVAIFCEHCRTCVECAGGEPCDAKEVH